MRSLLSSLAVFGFAVGVGAFPRETTGLGQALRVRDEAKPDNIVYVTSTEKFCIIAPRHAHTNIGASEHKNGMRTFCSPKGKYDDSQGTLPKNFWRDVEFKNNNGVNGGRTAQLTGCVNVASFEHFNPKDQGGQYDSSGGENGKGNPHGSICLGYNHYVQLLEPANSRACIKCCDDPADCVTTKDTKGCLTVIPGKYFDCRS